MNAIDRLLALQAENDARGERFAALSPRFLQLKQRHELGTSPRAVVGFNLFQTPKPIASEMASKLAGFIEEGSRVLEPSAGLGRLCEPFDLGAARLRWSLVEDVGECCRALTQAVKRAEVRNSDFLSLSAGDLGGKFDAVIMNPPFKRGTDVRHIEHALGMVKEGGRLVTLCYDGAVQREKVKPYATEWRVLPPHSFREEGTDANVAMAVFDL